MPQLGYPQSFATIDGHTVRVRSCAKSSHRHWKLGYHRVDTDEVVDTRLVFTVFTTEALAEVMRSIWKCRVQKETN